MPYSDVTVAAVLPTGAIPFDTYTRLRIEAVKQVAGTPMPYRKRQLLLRVALGKRYLNSAVLKSSIGKFTATTTLLTADHASSSDKGEAFNRMEVGDAFNFPLFLVSNESSGAVASFDLQATASDDNHAAGASLALQATKQLIEVAEPGSSVVTTLTSERAKDVATAIDSTFDRIFASSIGEEHPFDLTLTTGATATLTVYMPCREGEWDTDSKDVAGEPAACQGARLHRVIVGQWSVTFDAPRPSLFSDLTVPPCTPPAATCAVDARAFRD